MDIKVNILKLLQNQYGLEELPYSPFLNPDNTINAKRKSLVNNGDSYKINIEVTQRVINDEFFHVTYKEIADNDTNERWITDVSGSCKSGEIRANILAYKDLTGTNEIIFRGHDTYFFYGNMLLKFKYGSNQGYFFKEREFTETEFKKLKEQYPKREFTKEEVKEILSKLDTPAAK